MGSTGTGRLRWLLEGVGGEPQRTPAQRFALLVPETRGGNTCTSDGPQLRAAGADAQTASPCLSLPSHLMGEGTVESLGENEAHTGHTAGARDADRDRYHAQ